MWASAVAALACAAIALGCVVVPRADAQTRITVGGAGPLYFPNLITNLPVGRFYLLGTDEEGGQPLSILDGYDLLNHVLGENWFPGSKPQVVNYPASIGLASGSLAAPSADDAVAMGRVSLDDQIKNAAADGRRVAIAGLSEGAIVINRELAHLATTPGAPLANQLSFALFSSPELGIADTYLPARTTVPLINYTVQNLADSQYDVAVVFHQYDAWADPPDRPWNLLSVVNAFAGALYFHNNAALAKLSDTVEVSHVTSRLGGTTTTYMIPSPTLPLLRPLKQLDLPTQLVDSLNSALKPIVDSGYSRIDPDAGPYFSHGRLLGPPSAARSAVAARPTAASMSRAPSRSVAPAPAATTPTGAGSTRPVDRLRGRGQTAVRHQRAASGPAEASEARESHGAPARPAQPDRP